MYSESSQRRCGWRIAALLAAMLVSACDDNDLSLPTVDAAPYPAFKQYDGASVAEVRAALGEPDIAAIQEADSEEWAYAVRCCDPAHAWRVPAVHLRLFFDGQGVLRDWGFFHPRTGERMELKESLEQAGSQLPACSKFPLIADMFKVGETEQFEAPLLLQQYSAFAVKNYVRKVPWVEKHGDGAMLTFFVDRPSPFLWPPAFHIMTIRNGQVSVGSFSGYTGGHFCGQAK